VYQNGVRINEAFGDIVNFDLIPPQAIQRIDVVTGNPVFGLNALGGAVNIQMKNGFTWQGTEISAWGGSDARTAGYLEYGKVSGPWSVYFTGDGLNDRGWRYESPSTIGRLYGDIGYRSQDAEFHLIGLAARSFYGAAAATPVDFTHRDPRAIFTFPQTTTTEVGTLQLTGRVGISPATPISAASARPTSTATTATSRTAARAPASAATSASRMTASARPPVSRSSPSATSS
jgi:iron complex outermembrane recepter protein